MPLSIQNKEQYEKQFLIFFLHCLWYHAVVFHSGSLKYSIAHPCTWMGTVLKSNMSFRHMQNSETALISQLVGRQFYS